LRSRSAARATGGWQVLRYTTHQIRAEFADYCLPGIVQTINKLAGLTRDGLAPRRFVALPEGEGQQLSLFG
jgi:hypothetical protein